MRKNQIALLIFYIFLLQGIFSQKKSVVLPVIGTSDSYLYSDKITVGLDNLNVPCYSTYEVFSSLNSNVDYVTDGYNSNIINYLRTNQSLWDVNYIITISVKNNYFLYWIYSLESNSPILVDSIYVSVNIDNDSDINRLCECIKTVIFTMASCQKIIVPSASIPIYNCDSLRAWNELGKKWYQDNNKLLFWWNNCLNDEWRTAITLHQGINNVQLEKDKLRDFLLTGSLELKDNIVITNLEGCRYLPELRTINVRCSSFQSTAGAEDTPQLVNILYRSIQINKPIEEPKLNELRIQNRLNRVNLFFYRQ